MSDGRPRARVTYTALPAETRRRIVDELVELLNNGATKTAMKKHCGSYGLKWRASEMYIARARARRLEQLGKPPEEHLCDAYAVYRRIVFDPESSGREVVLAQREILRMLGLVQGDNVVNVTTNVVNSNVQASLTEAAQDPDYLEYLRQRVIEAEERKGIEANGNGHVTN